jgi:hypothetical protein
MEFKAEAWTDASVHASRFFGSGLKVTGSLGLGKAAWPRPWSCPAEGPDDEFSQC